MDICSSKTAADTFFPGIHSVFRHCQASHALLQPLPGTPPGRLVSSSGPSRSSVALKVYPTPSPGAFPPPFLGALAPTVWCPRTWLVSHTLALSQQLLRTGLFVLQKPINPSAPWLTAEQGHGQTKEQVSGPRSIAVCMEAVHPLPRSSLYHLQRCQDLGGRRERGTSSLSATCPSCFHFTR